MDALLLLKKFLREMSLGFLFAALAILLLLATPFIFFVRYVKIHLLKKKGDRHDSLHSRQPYRGDNPVVNKGKRSGLHAGIPQHGGRRAGAG